MKFIIGTLILAVALAQDPSPPPPVIVPVPMEVATPVVQVSVLAENVKLASKEWKNYKGCDDTCLALCLEDPAGYDSKCSVLFSNNTLTKTPKSDSCKKASVIQDCTYQCSCACKRCSFCKQELVNSCADDKNHNECIDQVIDQIIVSNKCD